MSRFNTPLRYPGGKQKLTPFVLEVMKTNDLVDGHYVEPYAGGAGVAIELLMKGMVSRIHLNDVSKPIFAFWYSVLNHSEEFTKRIATVALNVEEWYKQKEILSRPSEFSVFELGFSLFYLNRCNRSGIPSGGIIGGKNQTGRWKIDARFTRSELVRRVESIALKRDLITMHNLDAEVFLHHHLPILPQKTLIYCDPPYYQRSKRLYLNNYTEADHKRIAKTIQGIKNKPWMVSYDNVPPVLGLYKKQTTFVYDLQYHAAGSVKGSEVFFFSSNLSLPTSSKIPAIHEALTTVR